MVQHRAALCQLWHVQMAENAQKVPEFPSIRAPRYGVQRDACPTAPLGVGPVHGAT